MGSPISSLKNSFSCLMIVFLIAACGSNDSDPNYPDSVIGSWFICEFDNANDCSILDDDGFTLTSDERILRIEESSQGSLEQCGGPCFSSNEVRIQVAQAPIGTYSYSGGQLSVSISDCNETSTLLIANAESFIQILTCDDEFDGSSTANGSLLRKFAGVVDIVNE